MIGEETVETRKVPFVVPGTPREDILKLLDGLEDLADSANSLFGKAWGVDLEEFHMLTNKIRASLPDEMRKATRVANDSTNIVAAAREDAESILEKARRDSEAALNEARQTAAKLIDSSEVNRLAKEQAQEILNGAESAARDIRRGADEYAREVLAAIENHLAKVMGALQKGREKLENRIDIQHSAEPIIPMGRGVGR